ncbi:MAG: glycerate kinase, partial [Clostridia bacterium]|nr:glycerate kinase [Clostridia bacterium]
FAFMTFLGGNLQSGVQIVLDETKLEEKIKNSDIVITGEGRLDSQTVMGKAPIGVAKLAKKHGKPVIAFSGCVTPDADVCNEHGIDAFFPIVRSVVTLNDALNTDNAKKNMESTVKQVFNLINLLK